MKLKTSDIVIEKSGILKEINFAIDENNQGLIFDMFRSKIYRKPIESICREISANSRDANRESGNEHIPIKIKIFSDKDGTSTLLNNSSLYISFEDNGIGISTNRMEEIFCKYGSSTKRKTNDFTGGYGIGAKTPFSYTDLFIIETINDGQKYIYSAYIDETLVGKIALQTVEKTTETTGTKIIMPLKSEDDRLKFEKAVYMYTIFWKIRPEYLNFKTKLPKIENITSDTIKRKNNISIYRIEDKDIFTFNSYILIDDIPYEIFTDKNVNIKIETFSSGYKNNMVILYLYHFKNGELDISINRENLQYTSETIKIINTFIEKTKVKLKKNVTTFMNKSKDYVTACYNFEICKNEDKDKKYSVEQHNMNGIFLWLRSQNEKLTDFKFKNKHEIKSEFRFGSAYKNSKIYSTESFGDYDTVSFKASDLYLGFVYYTESFVKNKNKSLAIIDLLKNNDQKYFHLICNKKFRFSKQDYHNEKKQEEIYDTNKELEDTYVNLMKSYLKDYKAVKALKTKVEKKEYINIPIKTITESTTYTYGYRRSSNTRSFNLLYYKDKKCFRINNTEKPIKSSSYFFYEVENLSAERKFEWDILRTIQKYCNIHKKRLFIVNKRYTKYFPKSSNANIKFDKKNVKKSKYIKEVFNIIDIIYTKKEVENTGYHKLIFNNIYRLKFDKLYKAYNDIDKKIKEQLENNLETVRRVLSESFESSKENKNILIVIKNIEKKYPILTHFSSYRIGKDNIKDLNTYINLVDNYLKVKRNEKTS